MQTQMYAKGIVAIPKQAREAAGIKTGTRLKVVVTQEGILLVSERSVVAELRALCPKDTKEIDFEKHREEMYRTRLARAGINVH
ncbi:AbrB/MazE/SpoVT family DNA-binding domain-containing protein [archaeon]|nr:AbrB/MazE/SpoVT family DNA-binding domain-containing protein [archaeon]